MFEYEGAIGRGAFGFVMLATKVVDQSIVRLFTLVSLLLTN
jgi:hypothetical protein